MKTRKIPVRKCLVTGERVPKEELIRVVKTPEGNVEVDLSGKKNGRGAYIKNDELIFEKARKSKVLNRVFEMEVQASIYDELKDSIKK